MCAQNTGFRNAFGLAEAFCLILSPQIRERCRGLAGKRHESRGSDQ